MFRSTSLLRHFSSPKIWIPLVITFVLIGTLTALFLPRLRVSMQVPCGKENLTGTVQTISPVSETGETSIGLITQGHTQGRVDTLISINSFVHVSMQQGTACNTAQRRSLSDLKVGQTVKVWSSSGITLTSYPGQLQDVTDVVILE
jgi:hypothetical protein